MWGVYMCDVGVWCVWEGVMGEGVVYECMCICGVGGCGV